MMMKESLESYLLKNIPISSAMGIQVELATLNKLVLSAPFANNINHKKNCFWRQPPRSRNTANAVIGLIPIIINNVDLDDSESSLG